MNTFSKMLCVVGAFLSIVACEPAATSDAADDVNAAGFSAERLDAIDDAINVEIDAGKIAGAVALVVREGEVAYFKSFGYSDLDSKKVMRDDDIFRIASMTKAVTTAAAMILLEQGHYKLDDPVAKYIPAFADMRVVSALDDQGRIETSSAASKPIRIIDLLTHSSGIGYPFIDSSVQKTYVEAGVIDGLTARDVSLASQMQVLAQQPLMFEPGSEFAYGLSSDLVGYLVEVVSGRPLDQFFTEEIFAPLSMNDTFFYLPEDRADRLVTLYAHVEGEGLVVAKGNESSIYIDDPQYPVRGARTYFSGGAGLSSTTRDYARFLQMLLNDGELQGVRVLTEESVSMMRAARIDLDKNGVPDYGLGFRVAESGDSEPGSRSPGSYAWGGAFNTSFWVDPQENLIGVFMSQARPVDSGISRQFTSLVYQALE